MATFGKTNTGTADNWPSSDGVACIYTLSEAGSVSKVTFYVKMSETTDMVCAIYAVSGTTLGARQGITNQVSVGTDYSWVDFPFAIPIELEAGTYALAFSAMTGARTIYNNYANGAANQTQRKYSVTGNFPNPWGTSDSYYAFEVSIYATYTATGGATVKKGSSVASTMMQMLNSKMLFSTCNPYALRV